VHCWTLTAPCGQAPTQKANPALAPGTTKHKLHCCTLPSSSPWRCCCHHLPCWEGPTQRQRRAWCPGAAAPGSMAPPCPVVAWSPRPWSQGSLGHTKRGGELIACDAIMLSNEHNIMPSRWHASKFDARGKASRSITRAQAKSCACTVVIRDCTIAPLTKLQSRSLTRESPSQASTVRPVCR
jgi:hypothetical protein